MWLFGNRFGHETIMFDQFGDEIVQNEYSRLVDNDSERIGEASDR